MYPAVAEVVKDCDPKFRVIPLATLMGMTALPKFEMVPPAVLIVAFAVALIPATVMLAPVMVGAAFPKLMIAPPVVLRAAL